MDAFSMLKKGERIKNYVFLLPLLHRVCFSDEGTRVNVFWKEKGKDENKNSSKEEEKNILMLTIDIN